ncbi:MAG: hypothetical protein KDH94_01655 [Coxiellaceae bacterium]|nr:hypothetical protein [Coxiellaceae bacterium]
MKKLFISFSVLLMLFFTSLSFAGNPQYDDSGLQVVDGKPLAKSVNLRVFVPGLFVGYVGGVWDIAISDVMSFGPIVRVFVLGKYDGYDFGFNANYSLSGNLFSSGWVLNPYVEYYHGNYDQPLNASGVREKVSTVVLGADLMYQWMFNNGFNVMAGLGLEYTDQEIPVTMITDSDFHPHFEVTIGYAF